MTERSAGTGAGAGLGHGVRSGAAAIDPTHVVALALSVVWIVGAVVALLLAPSGAGGQGAVAVAAAVAVIAPVVLIWVTALAIRAARILRDERLRIEAAVDAIRHAAAEQSPVEGSGVRAPVEAKLDEIARAQRQAEAAISRLAQQKSGGSPAAVGRAPAAPARAPSRSPEAAQPSLALGSEEDEPADPVPNAEFVRALNFPEDERDAEGFRALRHALRDRFSGDLIRSAQDVLTLLAEDGIYTDDLAPDRARPEIWRRFAQGERGKAIAALGGVRDRSSLALTSGRMRQDPVFRDTAHHFLRKFDRAFAAFEPRASDADIVALAETRTARAFMLLGRVSGTFD